MVSPARYIVRTIAGEEGMIGEDGTAKSDIHNEVKVLVHGEYWNASSDRPIPAGVRGRVARVQGLKIDVEQIDTNAA